MKKINVAWASSFMIGMAMVGSTASALELDWTGQFRSDVNLIHNYTMDSRDSASTTDANRRDANGYYVPAAGQKSANFQSLFLRLRPKLVVNDNVYIKSEWWVGDPVYGFFGNGAPYAADQRQLNSTFNRGASISAQRFWAEVLTDFGTLQVGRAPLNYGLGLVWSSGDGLFDRYQSTGDVIRLVSKFGVFSFSPAFVSYATGNTIGGACTATFRPGNGTAPDTYACTPGAGSGGINDYSIMLQYDNPEEDFEAGVNFIRRLAGADQDASQGFLGPNAVSAGMNYNIWDIFARRKLGRFTFSGEMPVTTGTVGGVDYSALGLAVETGWKINDSWEMLGRLGQAPGQSSSAGAGPDKWDLFYFHPNYKIGMIMFNYQLANFAGLNTQNDPRFSSTQLQSPYNNPITNARYLGLSGRYKTNKWSFHGDFVFAKARKVATGTDFFYNTWQHRMVQKNAAAPDQQDSLGWEMDYGTSLQWDDNIRFGLDFGFYFPGSYYKFSNTDVENETSMVFATVLSAGITF